MDTSTITAVRSRRVRRLAAVGFVAALVVGLAACGDDDDTASSGGSATTVAQSGSNGGGSSTTAAEESGSEGEEVSYEITDIAYTDLTVPAGAQIEITNSSGAPHTFTADDGSFDEEVATDGPTYVQAPSEPGSYPFHCEIHPSMTATLTVE